MKFFFSRFISIYRFAIILFHINCHYLSFALFISFFVLLIRLCHFICAFFYINIFVQVVKMLSLTNFIQLSAFLIKKNEIMKLSFAEEKKIIRKLLNVLTINVERFASKMSAFWNLSTDDQKMWIIEQFFQNFENEYSVLTKVIFNYRSMTKRKEKLIKKSCDKWKENVRLK